MISKNWKTLIAVSLMLWLIFTVACSVEKNVRSEEFNLFKKEISSNEKISEIQIKFRRPSLSIYLITSENFEIDDVEKVIDKLKPVINVEHMDEIANKYWAKDARVDEVHLYFYNGQIDNNDLRKNLMYSIFTRYYKTYIVDDNPSNIDAYKTWFIEVGQDVYQFEDYLVGNY